NIINTLKVAAIFVLPQIALWILGVFPLRTFIDDFENIVKRVKRKRRGNVFKCQNPDCAKSSFCDHFRPIPGQKCKKCTKCDLYKTEDEEKVIKEAAAKARAEFIKTHPEAREANLLQNAAIGPVAGN
ncbi:7019_t:CDS:2, partial [Dentiscutata heterogama]